MALKSLSKASSWKAGVILCVVATAAIVTVIILTVHGIGDSNADTSPNQFLSKSQELEVQIDLASDDPLVTKAAKAVQNYINNYRAERCSMLHLYEETPHVQYAKRLKLADEVIQFELEISFGIDVYFARTQRIHVAAQNSSDVFANVSCNPDPCNTNVLDTLALSAIAVKQINDQNLTWTAAPYPQFRGKQIKDIVGSNLLSEQKRRAYLSQLGSPQSMNSSEIFQPRQVKSTTPKTIRTTTPMRRKTTTPKRTKTTTPKRTKTTTPKRTKTTTPKRTKTTTPKRTKTTTPKRTKTTTPKRTKTTTPKRTKTTTPKRTKTTTPKRTKTTSPKFTTSLAQRPRAQTSSAPRISSSPARRATTSLPAPRPTTARLSSTPARATTSLPAPRLTTPARSVSLTPPAAFDGRDVYPGQDSCKAFDPPDQGSCNSCYAFAASMSFSARLCRENRDRPSLGNVVISAQQLMDCTSGCAGGSEYDVYNSLLKGKAVEDWCDPYTQSPKTCGTTCGASNVYGALPGSVRQVGGAGAYGNVQMQLELIRSGPGVVSFMAMNDIFGYSSGVYTPSAAAVLIGSHAVSLVGWGVDRGVPYWLCQNAWGAWWGERGYLRIARGPHASSIENHGMLVLKPLPLTQCPNSNCAAGSTTLKDCTCKCPPWRSGPTCAVCALTCLNGGVRDAGCLKCSCPVGFWGPRCQAGYTVSSFAACAQSSGGGITVSYSFPDGSVKPPTQTSFVGLYQVDESNPFKTSLAAQVCKSSGYSAQLNRGLCPASGSFTIPRPTTAGRYKIVVAPYSPPNGEGMDGFYPLQDSNIIGYYTLLPAGCSTSSLSAAAAVNDPAVVLTSALSAAAAAAAAKQSLMTTRLDAVQPLLAALQAEPPAAISIVGANVKAPFVWLGTPGVICFQVPPSANAAKKLTLYVGDGTTGTYYPNVLGAASGPLTANAQGCVDFSMSRGLPVGQYTLGLENADTGQGFAAYTLYTDKATVTLTSIALSGPTILLVGVSWNVPSARATVRDIIRAVNTRGEVVAWAYTSCKCQTKPASGAAASATGSVLLTLNKATALGGCTFELVVDGVQATVAPNWIPWARFGWG